MSKLAQVVIDFFNEDKEAWEGQDFLNFTTPRQAGYFFLSFLQDEANELHQKTNGDNWALLSLLIDLLHSDVWTEEDLNGIGNAIINRAD